MTRLRRWLSGGLLALCLLSSVAVAVLWVRSGSAMDEVYVSFGGRTMISVVSAHGVLQVSGYRHWPDEPPLFRHGVEGYPMDDAVSPVYAVCHAGASRTEWNWRGYSAAQGTVAVALRADGSVDWDSPVLPMLWSMASLRYSPPFPFASAAAPHAAVLAMFMVIPSLRGGLAVAGWSRRRRRRRAGRCVGCGYDLTGNASGTCPECGATAHCNGGK